MMKWFLTVQLTIQKNNGMNQFLNYTGEPVEVIGMNIKLRIKVNYDGTKYFTNVNGGYFKEHKSLEDAKNWLDYNGYKNFDTETIVSFSY